MSEKIWFYAEGGQQVGPYSADEMKSIAESGSINGQTHVWKNGMEQWLPMEQVTELLTVPKATRLNLGVTPVGSDAAGDDTDSHLRLGAGRNFDTVNQKDQDPEGSVNVLDMLKGPEGENTAEPRIVNQSKVGFFESFGLSSFEAAFFAVTLIIAGITCLFMQAYWHVIVMGVGALWVFAAGWALIVRAFIHHWAWGLLCFFIPPVQLIYIIVDFRNACKPLVLYLVGVAAIITPTKMPGFAESPIFEHVEALEEYLDSMIQEQQQQMEESRNQKLDQFDEDN